MLERDGPVKIESKLTQTQRDKIRPVAAAIRKILEKQLDEEFITATNGLMLSWGKANRLIFDGGKSIK